MPHTPVHAALSPRRAAQAVAAFAVLDVFFLLGTWGFDVFYWEVGAQWPAAPQVRHLLVQLSLAQENVLAVWYASVQLLAVAGLAVLCFVVDGRSTTSARALSYGWLGLAALFTALSLDESGSLHERVSMLGTATHPWLGWTLLLALLAGMGAYATAFAVVHLRRSWATLALIVLGVVLFGSIPLQENVESGMKQLAENPEGWRRPALFLLLEEGAELAATLCFLAAAAVYASRRRGRLLPVDGRAAAAWALALVLVLAAAMGAVEVFVAYAAEGDAGIPPNWFASLLALLTGGVSLHLWLTRRQRAYGAVALASVTAAVYVGANLYGYLYRATSWGSLDRFQLVLGTVVALAVAATGSAVARRAPTRWSRAGTYLWVLLLAGAATTEDVRLTPFLAFVAFGALLPSLLVHYGALDEPRGTARVRSVAEQEG